MFFTADSKKLVIDKNNREAVILDTHNWKELSAIGEPGGIKNVIALNEGQTFTTFGKDKSFKRWDALTGELLWQRKTKRPDDSLEISANGQRFADRSADGNYFEIGELLTGKIIARVPAGKWTSAILSDDGSGLLLIKSRLKEASYPNQKYSEIELWDVERTKQLLKQKYQFRQLRAKPLPGNRFVVLALFSSQKERKIILDVFQAGQSTKLWSASFLASFGNLVLPKHSDETFALSVNNKTKFFETSTGNLVLEVDGEPSAIVVNHKNNLQMLTKRDRSKTFGNQLTLDVRNRVNGKMLKEIPVPSIDEVAISRNGRLLFSDIENDFIKGVKIWNVQDWKEVGFIEMNRLPVHLFPLPDPDLIAVIDILGGAFRAWRISTGEEIYHLWHTLTADKIQLASSVNRIMTVEAGKIRLWDADTGGEIAYHVNDGTIYSISISPDGSMIAYTSLRKKSTQRGGDYRPLTIWKPDSKDDSILIPMQSPNTVLFSPSGHYLAVRHGNKSDEEHKVQVLNSTSLRTIATIHRLPGSSISDMKFSLDGQLLFFEENKDRKRSQRIFSLQPFREIARVDDIWDLEFIPSSQNIITKGKNRNWYSWNPKLADMDELILEIPGYISLKPVKNSENLLGYDLRAGVELINLNQHSRKSVLPKVEGRFVRGIASKKNGSHVAIAFDHFDSGKETGQVVIRDFANDNELAQLSTGVSMRAMAFVDKGNAIVMSDTPGIVLDSVKSALWLWHWRQGNLQKLSNDNPINAISVNPDGLLIATGEGDRDTKKEVDLGVFQVRIWDAQTGKEIKRISQPDVVHDVAFSPDGKYVAVKLTHKIIVYQTHDWSQLVVPEDTLTH